MTDSTASSVGVKQHAGQRQLLKQATIPPVERDGVLPFSVGTLGALLAFAVLRWSPRFTAAWLWQSALVSVLIGIVGTGYCLYRRSRRRAAEQSNR